MENLVELKREELMEIEGGTFWFRALRVVAVAAAALSELYQGGSDPGTQSDWASSACEGCQA